MSSGRHRTEAARPRVVRLAGEKSVRQGSSGGLCSRTTRSTRAWRRLCTLQPLQRGRRQQIARAASWHRCLGIKITELAADLKEKTTRRERGCRGRRHCCTQSPQRDASQIRLSAWRPGRRRTRKPEINPNPNQTRISTWPPMCAPRGQGRCSRTVARSQVPEDYTKSPRRRARSKIVLARRGRLVSRSGENNGETRRAVSRARFAGPSDHAQPVGNARHARRRLAGIVRRARRRGGKCTNSRCL